MLLQRPLLFNLIGSNPTLFHQPHRPPAPRSAQRRREAAPASARAESIQRRYYNDRGFAILDALDQVAAARGLTVAQVALAWLLTQPVITAPIIGANSTAQLDESLGAAGVRLSPEEMDKLNTVSA